MSVRRGWRSFQYSCLEQRWRSPEGRGLRFDETNFFKFFWFSTIPDKMGVVVEALDSQTKEKVTIKKISPFEHQTYCQVGNILMLDMKKVKLIRLWFCESNTILENKKCLEYFDIIFGFISVTLISANPEGNANPAEPSTQEHYWYQGLSLWWHCGDSQGYLHCSGRMTKYVFWEG